MLYFMLRSSVKHLPICKVHYINNVLSVVAVEVVGADSDNSRAIYSGGILTAAGDVPAKSIVLSSLAPHFSQHLSANRRAVRQPTRPEDRPPFGLGVAFRPWQLLLQDLAHPGTCRPIADGGPDKKPACLSVPDVLQDKDWAGCTTLPLCDRQFLLPHSALFKTIAESHSP